MNTKAKIIIVVVALAVLFYFFGKKGVSSIVNAIRQSGERWDNLIPEMKQKAQATIDAANAAGLGVMFWEGWRSPEDEQADIDKGTSKLKDPYNGRHVWGAAVDLVFVNAAGAPSWPDLQDPRWSRLIAIAKQNGLIHPISWDGPHFEIPGFSIASVRQEYGTNYQGYIDAQT